MFKKPESEIAERVSQLSCNGKRVYRGQWIVREPDGSLGCRDYGTHAEQSAHDEAEEEIEECADDGNFDPVRHHYPIIAASEARLSAKCASLTTENERKDTEIARLRNDYEVAKVVAERLADRLNEANTLLAALREDG